MRKDLVVRNVDDETIELLKRRARRHGRSIEAEHRVILRQALVPELKSNFARFARELRKLTRQVEHTPSEILVRKGRDER